ncbi:MAG: hypothetical protein AABY49_13240 [Planctomycetota bacterium]
MRELVQTIDKIIGKTRLTDWIEKHAESLGRQYTSELARRIDRETEYWSN